MMSLNSIIAFLVVATASGAGPATVNVNAWVNEANNAAAQLFMGDSTAFETPHAGLIASSRSTSAQTTSNLRFWKGMHSITDKVNVVKAKKEAISMKPAESALEKVAAAFSGMAHDQNALAAGEGVAPHQN
eukprot:gnl/MRDRNA2_/MRDRNA2_91240_c0_seq1.p1 gnl/MRDRNA2_/MRDRNA2_91240_c0~~gnl/MRDRNA2_/MRDRNA2_91240_c0_seq1.p1  ORF type:complete len:131 (-),score=34.44 gnl/MRDRNA2_/MRDRNA2_91240_c0_seq1:20-412(-)